jgi:hypothetical protein
MYTLTVLDFMGERSQKITTRYLSDAIKYLKMNLYSLNLLLEDETTGETLFDQELGVVFYNIFDLSDKKETED